MSTTTPYQQLIFDFDGTLANSFPFFLSHFNGIAQQHGFRQIDLVEAGALRSLGARELMRKLELPLWKLPRVSASFLALMRHNALSVSLFDGIAPALRALATAGVRLSIVTANAEDNVRAILGDDLAHLFDDIDGGMSMFAKAKRIKRLCRPRAKALYIGDQGSDAEAAREAGIAFGAVAWGYAPLDALRAFKPDEEFHHTADLLRLANTPS